jgi:bifunctional DNA-binding transcriptional regulator/antitoxin component of YhaV-PrlF toxin-antitoxin module
MRQQLGLKPGSKLAVFCDGSRLLMKPISKPQVAAFADLITRSEKVMAKTSKKEESTK